MAGRHRGIRESLCIPACQDCLLRTDGSEVHKSGRIDDTSRSSIPAKRSDDPIRIAYLVSRYPAVSHTFILREVERLRRANFEICVASINSPDRSADGMTAEERGETATTFYVKREGI